MSPRDRGQSFRIRDARLSDAPQLPSIEISAAQSFSSIPALRWIATSSDAIAIDVHRKSIQAGNCWVAVDHADMPVGFLTATVDRPDVHILEMSVEALWQGNGIGAALLWHLKQWALCYEMESITLTTFRDVPWNAAFYAKTGFDLLSETDLDHRLASILAEEESLGFPQGSRCAMRLELDRIVHRK